MNGNFFILFFQHFQFMKKFFFGSFCSICTGNDAILTFRQATFFFQPFIQKIALFLGKFVGKTYFSISCSQNKIFSRKIQICGQCRKFPFHGFTVDLNQKLVSRTQGLICFSTICVNGIRTLIQRQIAIYGIA